MANASEVDRSRVRRRKTARLELIYFNLIMGFLCVRVVFAADFPGSFDFRSFSTWIFRRGLGE